MSLTVMWHDVGLLGAKVLRDRKNWPRSSLPACNDAGIEAVEHATVEIGRYGCSLECRVAMS